MGTKLQYHPFHIVSVSPWPYLTSFSLWATMVGFVIIFQEQTTSLGIYLIIIGLTSVILISYQWWRDVVREGLYEGSHTLKVQKGLTIGFILFVLSEVMLFLSFFWAFFHASLSPNVELGCIWPPAGLLVLNPWSVPFLNTLVLVLSGATVTWAHQLMLVGNFYQTNWALGITINLALFFTCLQFCEYADALFDISDGTYGSVFFLLTGLHGMHVLVGTIFLTVCLIRNYFKQFTRGHHIGFECAIWYWHFVDVVWLFLFIFVYWWGNS